jgi:hypothetical protein
MITINTQTLDTKIEALILEANKIMNFKKERVEILNGAVDLIQKFVNDSACKDLIIDNMYSSGHENFNGMHNEDSSLLCIGTVSYKNKTPKNLKLFAKKMEENFNKIVTEKEPRLTMGMQHWNAKNEGAKFTIYVNK